MRRWAYSLTRASVATTAALGVAACYLTTDTSGLSSAGAADGLPETGPDALADAPVEGSTSDARDASGDGSFSCSGATFCDDFERTDALGA